MKERFSYDRLFSQAVTYLLSEQSALASRNTFVPHAYYFGQNQVTFSAASLTVPAGAESLTLSAGSFSFMPRLVCFQGHA